MKEKKYRVLLAEDDRNMNYMLRDSLEMNGYEVAAFTDGSAALSAFISTPFDLCILDVMLPKKDGFTIAREIRKLNLVTPIVFLTAKSQKEDRIQGLRIGADDYMTKPFSVEELLLRIEGILKRVYGTATRADQDLVSQLGNMRFDFSNQRLTLGDNQVTLTHKEARLLLLFSRNANKVIARDLIQKAIWEDEGYFVGRSLDVFVSRLRKLLSMDPSVQLASVHGVGYKLQISPPQNDSPHP